MILVAVLYRLIGVSQWVAWGLLFLGAPLQALDPSQRITQYAHNSWDRENGHLPASVFALTQTADGRLWIGTDSGLQQFDGVRFQTWKAPPGQSIASEYVTALAPAREGGLWIGTREALSLWKDSEVRNYRVRQGPSGPAVAAILVDKAGTVWAATAGFHRGGLCRVKGSALDCDSVGRLPGLAAASLLEERAGTLWVGGFGLCRRTPETSLACPVSTPSEVIRSIVQDSEGGIWVGGNTLKRLTGSGLAAYPPLTVEPTVELKTLLLDRDGGLWIGTFGQGLIHMYRGRIDRFRRNEGLSDDYVRCLFEDGEGNIWVGTNGGLDRFREYAVNRISRRDGIPEGYVNSVLASRDGAIWIGSGRGLSRLRNGEIRRYNQRDGLPDDLVVGIFEQAAGRLWAFTPFGMAYSDGAGFHALHLPSGQKMHIRAAAETSDHSLWLSDPEHGLVRLSGTTIAELVPWSKFEKKQAWALEADAGGGLWLGFAQGGVAYYKPGQATRWYSSSTGATAAAVTDLHRSQDGSLWIATEAGLSRLRGGHMDTFTAADGLPCNAIRVVLDDDRGSLWLNTDCGLALIPQAELAKWSVRPPGKAKVRVFDAIDGMRRVARSTGYFRQAAKSKDGRLWFVSDDGAAVVNPDRLPENRVPPPVRIEEIVAGTKSYPVGSGLNLPPHTKELRIHYTAMSFVAPQKVRFRYRLKGFDHDWKEDAVNRHAVYTNLPPNRYEFQVIACNNDGVWNQTGASLDFSIQPALYQTSVFKILCALACAAMLGMAYRFRIRHVQRRLGLQFAAQVQERTRISREMHDSLLQEFCGFAMELDGLAKLNIVPASVRERLRELRSQAQRCARETRELVWDLRAPTLQEVDLSAALQAAGERITQGESVNFHVSVQGHPRPAPEKLQVQLLRIVQEATRNAVRYSRAKEIAMEISYLDSDRIRLQMRDDGCGFDMEQAAHESGHWGLRTMRERAEELGGELTILSAPGHGTSIEVVVPTAAAA